MRWVRRHGCALANIQIAFDRSLAELKRCVRFNSSFSPFRIEGKEAIRMFFAELMQMYPKRQVFIRQPTTRVYNDDLVVQDSYAVLNWSNAKGEPKTYDTRGNTVRAKIGGRWQIVDQHISRLPSAH